MGSAVKLREFSAGQLRALARCSDDANQTRRLLALSAIYDGQPRGRAAAALFAAGEPVRP